MYIDVKKPQKVSTKKGMTRLYNLVIPFTLSPCHFVLSSLRQIMLEERTIRKQVERVGHILDKETAEVL